VRVDTGAEAPAAEVGDDASAGNDSGDRGPEDDSGDGSGAQVEGPEVPDRPRRPLRDLRGQQGCGVLQKKQAQAVYEFVTGPGLGEADGALNVRVLPPGVAGCASRQPTARIDIVRADRAIAAHHGCAPLPRTMSRHAICL